MKTWMEILQMVGYSERPEVIATYSGTVEARVYLTGCVIFAADGHRTRFEMSKYDALWYGPDHRIGLDIFGTFDWIIPATAIGMSRIERNLRRSYHDRTMQLTDISTERAEHKEHLREALQGLTKRQRDILLLYYIREDMTDREVAARLGIRRGTAQRIRTIAIRKLRRSLKL